MKKIAAGFVTLLALLAVTYFTIGPERLLKLATKSVETEMVQMRDGTRLATDIYRPRFRNSAGTVFIATPYDKNAIAQFAAPLNAIGLAVVIQDDRGRFDSEGVWDAMAARPEDLFDTLDFIAAQQWSNGRVGMIGCSYPGQSALFAAQLDHPALKTVIAQAAGGAHGSHANRFRYGGASHRTTEWSGPPSEYIALMSAASAEENGMVGFKFNSIASSIAQFSASIPDLQSFMTELGEPYDHYDYIWQDYLASLNDRNLIRTSRPWIEEDTEVTVPILHVNSWDDYAPTETLLQRALFEKNGTTDIARDNQFAIISPMSHCSSETAKKETKVGDRYIGDARFPYEMTYAKWLSHWLSKAQEENFDAPKIRYFVMGDAKWSSSNEWPPVTSQEKRFYLSSQGDAKSRAGNGELQDSPSPTARTDRILFDPNDPYSSDGGANIIGRQGYVDRSELQDRNDVLVYTTAPFEEPLHVAGPMRANLFVSTSALDASFHVNVGVVYPDGTPYNLQLGGARLSGRLGPHQIADVESGQVYEIEIDLQSTANTFQEGSRLRVEVTASDYPRSPINYGRLNLFEKPAPDEIQPYEIQVHHGPEMSSSITLFTK